MNGLDIQFDGMTVEFGQTCAVDNITVRFEGNAITGLLGRNGAGKTTMLSTVASLTRPTRGRVRVGGCEPFENEHLMERICLIREGGDVLADEQIKVSLDYVAAARPSWDQGYAEKLLDAFELDPRKKANSLSRGQRSALGATIGLASRAPVTIFDEVYLGMDAPSRRRFYDLLLEDYIAHPRTIVLSSHLIGEVESLFEHVVIVDRGRVVVADEAESLRGRGATITGPSDRIATVVEGYEVLAERSLGSTTQVTVMGDLDAVVRRQLAADGFEVGAVPIEDLFISLTQKGSQS